MSRRIVCHIYNVFLVLVWPWAFFYYFLRTRLDGKYRGSYLYRMGLKLPPPFAKQPSAHPLYRKSTAPAGPSSIPAPGGCYPKERRIWVHALSVGETLSSVALVKALKDLYPEAQIVFSTSTETGQEIARKRLSRWVDSFFFLPHDFPWTQAFLVARVSPALFIQVETDIWPNLLFELERRGAPALLVNGRISPRSFARYMRFRSLTKDLLGRFELIFSQSSLDKERYEKLGMPPERVLAAGNIKFDSALIPVPPEEVERLREEAGIERGRAAWAAGSTHEGEEEVLLAAHRALRLRRPGLLLILAPRQTHRAPGIAALCADMGLSVATRSSRAPAEGKDVYLVDTLGELSIFYAFAAMAFIGGSLAPSGGHNPIEAIAQGVPALWGPHLFNFREMEAGLIAAGCGRRIASGAELERVLDLLLGDVEARRRMEAAAAEFLAAHSGCSRKIAEAALSSLI